MDSLTHIALGACIGEVFIGRSIGKKALLWGAVAQSLPDIDVVASLWLGTAENLLAHRGFTHSLLFALVLTPFLALLADKLHRPHNVRMQRWMWFFGTELLTHLFLDGLNAYGTGWLEPFSHYRFSLNTIFVADPLFSLLPGIACVALVLLKTSDRRRKAWYKLGIAGSVVYLVFCMTNKIRVERDVRNILQNERIACGQYMTTPTPFNNLLWYVVAGGDSGYYVGFRSVFDGDEKMALTFFPKNEHLLRSLAGNESLEHLKRFSKGFYTVEQAKGTLVFNDLRLGQVGGWSDPHADFVFRYYLQQPEENEMVMQRGRFKGWSREVWISLFRKVVEG